MKPEEEARLIEQAKADPQAFARLYDEFAPAVFSFVMRRVSNKEAAEDITSAVFYRQGLSTPSSTPSTFDSS